MHPVRAQKATKKPKANAEVLPFLLLHDQRIMDCEACDTIRWHPRGLMEHSVGDQAEEGMEGMEGTAGAGLKGAPTCASSGVKIAEAEVSTPRHQAADQV